MSLIFIWYSTYMALCQDICFTFAMNLYKTTEIYKYGFWQNCLSDLKLLQFIWYHVRIWHKAILCWGLSTNQDPCAVRAKFLTPLAFSLWDASRPATWYLCRAVMLTHYDNLAAGSSPTRSFACLQDKVCLLPEGLHKEKKSDLELLSQKH